jgi:hypothetical protein
MDQNSHWHLRLKPGCEARGPMSSSELMALASSGEATDQAWVSSEKVTNGQWVNIMRLPKLAAIVKAKIADATTPVTPVMADNSPVVQTATSAKNSWATFFIVGSVVVVMLCCGGLGTLVSSLPVRQPLTADEQAKYDASMLSTQCIRRVREAATSVLKSPATAEFDLDCQYVKLDKDFVYEVTGHVDSQNGFGALVRSTVRGVGLKNGQSVQVVEVYLNNKLVLQDKPSAERVEKLLKTWPTKDGTANN